MQKEDRLRHVDAKHKATYSHPAILTPLETYSS